MVDLKEEFHYTILDTPQYHNLVRHQEGKCG